MIAGLLYSNFAVHKMEEFVFSDGARSRWDGLQRTLKAAFASAELALNATKELMLLKDGDGLTWAAHDEIMSAFNETLYYSFLSKHASKQRPLRELRLRCCCRMGCLTRKTTTGFLPYSDVL